MRRDINAKKSCPLDSCLQEEDSIGNTFFPFLDEAFRCLKKPLLPYPFLFR